MAATYTKPATIPRWADTSSNLLAPPAGQLDSGWVYQSTAVSAWENWRANLVGQWIKWLDERLADGATANDFRIKDPDTGSTVVQVDGDGITPGTTATYSLGLTGSRFSDLWLSGNITATGTLACGAATVAGNLLPEATGTRDIGTTGTRFKNLWLSGNIVATGELSVGQIASDLIPKTTATYNLGSSSYAYNNCYVSRLVVTEQTGFYYAITANGYGGGGSAIHGCVHSGQDGYGVVGTGANEAGGYFGVSGGTGPAIVLAPRGSDPSTGLEEGAMWVNSGSHTLHVYLNSTIYTVTVS